MRRIAAMSRRQDPITWKQIGTGYLILICIGLGTAMALLDPHNARIASEPLRSVLPYAGFAILYGVWKLLERPLSQAGTYLAPTPDGQLKLKRTAVGMMWLLSISLSIAATRVTQVVNPW